MPSRLIDKLLSYSSLPDENIDARLNDGFELPLRDALRSSHVIESSNVARYIESEVIPKLPLRDGAFYLEDIKFPSLSPSFNLMFIEAADMKGINIGALCIRSPSTREGWKWFLGGIVFCPIPHHPHVGNFAFRLDESGQLNPKNPYAGQLDEFWEEVLSEDDISDFRGIVHNAAWLAIWTLAFMNTRNVVTESVEPNAGENKRRAKHGKPPLMRYHVLKIKPFGAHSDVESQGGTHAAPALHIRRGHFATYTDAAPMFGKLVGTYWKDQMLVGRKSDHVVVKGYEIDLGGQDSP